MNETAKWWWGVKGFDNVITSLTCVLLYHAVFRFTIRILFGILELLAALHALYRRERMRTTVLSMDWTPMMQWKWMLPFLLQINSLLNQSEWWAIFLIHQTNFISWSCKWYNYFNLNTRCKEQILLVEVTVKQEYSIKQCCLTFVLVWFGFRVFAANICSKIAEMIEDIATPVHLKLQLIPIMKNMYHDSSTASKVRFW